MKIRLVGAELFHSDGWTDMSKPTVAYRNFSNSPKNLCSSCYRNKMPWVPSP